MKRRNFLTIIFQISLILCFSACRSKTVSEEVFTTFIVDPNQSNVEFYWKDEQGQIFGSIENLKRYVERKGRRLRFAMNGGMYQKDFRPLGLFIQNGKIETPLDTHEGQGNFYLKPNGIFYIRSDKRAFITPTEKFINDGQIIYATQSGPMILIDGEINSQFKPDSENLNIRNAVCVLPGGEIVFAISRREVNFYDLAGHFKEAGCRDALYLDGFVSKMYAPEQNISQLDGDFGVIIAIVE